MRVACLQKLGIQLASKPGATRALGPEPHTEPPTPNSQNLIPHAVSPNPPHFPLMPGFGVFYTIAQAWGMALYIHIYIYIFIIYYIYIYIYIYRDIGFFQGQYIFYMGLQGGLTRMPVFQITFLWLWAFEVPYF